MSIMSDELHITHFENIGFWCPIHVSFLLWNLVACCSHSSPDAGIFLLTSVADDNRSGTVNSKSFVGKVLLQIKWKFKLNSNL